jgi:hypothetical protein
MKVGDPRLTILADGLKGIQSQVALLTKLLGEILSDDVQVPGDSGQGQQLPPMAGRNINRGPRPEQPNQE